MVTNKKTAAYSGSRSGRKRVSPLQKYIKKEMRTVSTQKPPFRSRPTTRTETNSNKRTTQSRTTRTTFRSPASKAFVTAAKRMVTNKITNRPSKAFYPNK